MTLIEKHHDELGRLHVHSALGLLELGLARAEPAIQTLERARDLADLHGITEPNIVHWQPDLVEAYARAGNPAAAHEVLAVLDQQAVPPVVAGHSDRRPMPRAADRNPSSEDCFDAAVEHLRAVAAPFDIAVGHGHGRVRESPGCSTSPAVLQGVDKVTPVGSLRPRLPAPAGSGARGHRAAPRADQAGIPPAYELRKAAQG